MVSVLHRGSSFFAARDLASRSLLTMPLEKSLLMVTDRHSITTGLTTPHPRRTKRRTGSQSSVCMPSSSALRSRCSTVSRLSGTHPWSEGTSWRQRTSSCRAGGATSPLPCKIFISRKCTGSLTTIERATLHYPFSASTTRPSLCFISPGQAANRATGSPRTAG